MHYFYYNSSKSKLCQTKYCPVNGLSLFIWENRLRLPQNRIKKSLSFPDFANTKKRIRDFCKCCRNARRFVLLSFHLTLVISLSDVNACSGDPNNGTSSILRGTPILLRAMVLLRALQFVPTIPLPGKGILPRER